MSRTSRTEPPQRRGFPLLRKVRSFYLGLQRDNLPRLILFVALLVLVGGLLVFFTETRMHSGVFSRMFDSIWWAFVTITTVGYGDKVPATVPGRILAILIMLLGIVAISTLSGTIASIFVDRKIREGKGLQEVNLRSHAVICGWNNTAERILEGLGYLYRGGKRGVVLASEMDPEEFQSLSARHPDMDLRFVRGDFSNEKVLRRASIQTARTAIILADTSGRSGVVGTDERTILTALAVKALNSEVNTIAEIIDGENEQHLRRANVDEILVNGEFNGFLLSSAAVAPAIPLVTKELLKVLTMRRQADVLVKPGTERPEQTPDSDETPDDKADEAEQANKPEEDSEQQDGQDDEYEEEPLPPDPNDRPEIDPQLETALFVARVRLLGESSAQIALHGPAKSEVGVE